MRTEDLARLSPPEAASKMLTAHEGVQRNAEAEAWHFAERYDHASQDYKFFVEVVRHIVWGGEFPAVERRQLVFAG